MSKAYFYKAFGLTIESCAPIAQLPPIEPCESDVRIVWADFSDLPRDRRKYTNPDGIFGSYLEEVVKQFQTAYKLDVDGVVGPKTWAKLLERA